MLGGNAPTQPNPIQSNPTQPNPIQSNPTQSNANKRAQVYLFARIFYNITYKLKHLQFQLTRNENCKWHLDQASVCLDDFWKYCNTTQKMNISANMTSITDTNGNN